MLYFDYLGYDEKIGREKFFNRKPIVINPRSFNINMMEDIIEERPKVINQNRRYEGEILHVQERQFNLYNPDNTPYMKFKNEKEVLEYWDKKSLIKNIKPGDENEDNKKYEKSSSGSLKEFAPEKKGMNYNYSLLYNKITGINFKDYSEMGEKYFEENESFRDIKFKGIILFIFLNFYFYF